MPRADWLQVGERITNPYMRCRDEQDCGVVRVWPAPNINRQLAKVIAAYLDVQKDLASDRFEASAISAPQVSREAWAATIRPLPSVRKRSRFSQKTSRPPAVSSRA